mgnify:CR=1 FL=1
MILIVSFTPASSELINLFPTYRNYTDDLIEFHVHAVHARSNDVLEQRLIDRRPVDLKEALINSPKEYGEYHALIQSYGTQWLMNDMRVLWFLKDFEKLVEVEGIIALKDSKNKRYNEFVDSVLGKRKDVLILDKVDLDEVEKWFNGLGNNSKVTKELGNKDK